VTLESVQKHNIVDAIYEQMKKNIQDGIWGAGLQTAFGAHVNGHFSG
jgi:hypothetical protein